MIINEQVKNHPSVIEYLKTNDINKFFKAIANQKEIGVRDGELRYLKAEDWVHAMPDLSKIKPCKKCGSQKKADNIYNGVHPMQCLDCVIEHLAKAMVNCEEVAKGYDGKIFADKPSHIPMLIGNIAEAEVQCVIDYKELSDGIRETKLKTRAILGVDYSAIKQELNILFYKALEIKQQR